VQDRLGNLSYTARAGVETWQTGKPLFGPVTIPNAGPTRSRQSTPPNDEPEAQATVKGPVAYASGSP
jgi:hypothetical protein